MFILPLNIIFIMAFWNLKKKRMKKFHTFPKIFKFVNLIVDEK